MPKRRPPSSYAPATPGWPCWRAAWPGGAPSDDFFWADRFPTAAFTLERLTPIGGSHLTTPNYTVEGSLEMMGIGVYQQFPATLTTLPDQRLAAEAHFDIDRTRWNIIYGSSRFFDHLGMHAVFDLISVQLRLVTL